MTKNKKKLTRLESLSLLTILLCKQFFLFIIKRQFRTLLLIRNDYDQGDWKSILNKKNWLHYQSLKEYLTALGGEELRVVKLHNELFTINAQEYYQFRISVINSVMLKYSSGDEELPRARLWFWS